MNFCVVSIKQIIGLVWVVYFVHTLVVCDDTCNNIKFIREGAIKQIGKWRNGCPNNRYVSGVWSHEPQELFYNGKCCGSGVALTEFSWEIRDFEVLVSEKNARYVQIECPLYSVITGFRLITGTINRNILSSVRCSLLNKKVFNASQCSVLDFKKGFRRRNETVRKIESPGPNEKWFQECQHGYGLVSLTIYKREVQNGLVQRARRGKCCHLYNPKFNSNWKSNFADNLAGFDQFKYPHKFEYVEKGQYIKSKNGGMLISPLVEPQIKGLCLVIRAASNETKAKIEISLNGKSSFKSTNSINLTIQVKEHSRYIRLLENYQIRITATEALRIYNISLYDDSKCKVDSCQQNGNDPPKGCEEHEMCVLRNDYQRCECQRNYTSDVNGRCVYEETGGSGKSATEMPALRTTARPVKLNPYDSSLVSVSIAGSSVAVILLVIGLSICLCYRNSIARKHRRTNSFEQEMSIVDRNNLLLTVNSSSKPGNRSIYRPYMDNLGCVEHLSVNEASRNPLELPPPRYCLDSSTGEPVYTQINKTVDKISNPQVIVNNNEEPEPKEQMSGPDHHATATRARRRLSCTTLLQPEYGASDSDEAECESEDDNFFIPGDDEEELIEELNEISSDTIKISSRVIGQGAFGVVKHGILYSVKGSQDVAIKMLKQRSSNELSKEDRIKFYQESVIVSQFDHKNIVAFFGVLVSNQPCMVLEYMSRGNLHKYLNKVRRIRQREGIETISLEMQSVFLKMARDIVNGMCYLASFKFVHRDLAARNILLAENEGDLICKISDFGLSRHFIKDERYYTSQGGHIPVKWTSPEALMFKKYSTQSDVWSYGIVLWEIWSFGQQPYENWSNEKVCEKVCNKAYRLAAPDAVPSLVYHLMIDCWCPDKSQRPTFPKLRFCLSHSDKRIIGKGYSKRSERCRPSTFSNEEAELPLDNSKASESQITC